MPDGFLTDAYDSVILFSYALRLSDETRSSTKETMAQLKDVPLVTNHKVGFNLASHIEDFLEARLVVKDGKVVRFKDES